MSQNNKDLDKVEVTKDSKAIKITHEGKTRFFKLTPETYDMEEEITEVEYSRIVILAELVLNRKLAECNILPSSFNFLESKSFLGKIFSWRFWFGNKLDDAASKKIEAEK